MTRRRVVLLALGLVFFTAVAVLAGLMAVAMGPGHPIMALWAAAPAPLVFRWLMLRRLRHRRLAVTYLVLAALVTIIFWVAGWAVSGQVREGALAREEDEVKYDLEVIAVGPDTITLRATVDAEHYGPWTLDGFWGMEGPSAYYQVSSKERSGRDSVWQFTRLKGDLKQGDRVRLDSWAWPEDMAGFPAPVETVNYKSPLGQFTALKTAGAGDTWAVFVHGRGAGPRQGLRLAPVFSSLGMPALFITYRNDEGVPASADGLYRYGQTEWQDLEGAVQYALDNGARRVVLVGWSMGGAIVESFLSQSKLAPKVAAVVLDAPMLDFGATVSFGGRQRGIPAPAVAAGKAASRYRFDVDWAALDYLERAARLSVPVLLIHGEADDTVPVETSAALAEKSSSGTVQYESFPGATHVTSWNTDRQRYEETMRAFLSKVVK